MAFFSKALRQFFRPRSTTTIPKRDNHSQNWIRKYMQKVRDNPVPLWAGFVVIGYLQYRRVRKRQLQDGEAPAYDDNSFEISFYKALPLRALSRCWGAINECELPVWSRTRLLGFYAKCFQCNIDEAEETDLTKYPNLSSFFRRRLKSHARPIDPQSDLVSPCDGKVLYLGPISNDRVEQVKNVTYSLTNFLGTAPPSPRPGNRLFQCVVYLAPGDYHCFHAPTDFKVLERRHFHGLMLSVNPAVAKVVPGLFELNERVVYSGRWRQGLFFSMVAVGATNVGSIRIGFDEELATNCVQWKNGKEEFKLFDKSVQCQKGDYFGEFNLGSTIVLVFEAPEDFVFNIKAGDTLKMGQTIQ